MNSDVEVEELRQQVRTQPIRVVEYCLSLSPCGNFIERIHHVHSQVLDIIGSKSDLHDLLHAANQHELTRCSGYENGEVCTSRSNLPYSLTTSFMLMPSFAPM